MKNSQTRRLMGACKGMLLCAPLMLGACASSLWTPDATFGEAVRQAKHTQVLDPAAPASAPAVSGTDAVIAKSAVDRYQKSFEVLPLPVNVLNIGVGTGVGAMGAR
jgi:hypothetical protein